MLRGSSKFLQNNNLLYIFIIYMTKIIYEYHIYFVYMQLFSYKSYVYVLTQASSAQVASWPAAMTYVAPAEFWLAWIPNNWKWKTLTCLLCNKEVHWLPWHQNGSDQAAKHAKNMRQLSYTSGIYYEIKRR